VDSESESESDPEPAEPMVDLIIPIVSFLLSQPLMLPKCDLLRIILNFRVINLQLLQMQS
jgi:hypothetical protein